MTTVINCASYISSLDGIGQGTTVKDDFRGSCAATWRTEPAREMSEGWKKERKKDKRGISASSQQPATVVKLYNCGDPIITE